MSEVDLGKRLERPTFTPYSELDPFTAEIERGSRTSRSRTIGYTPIRKIEGHYDEEQGAFVCHEKPGVEICPMCGAEVIHEAGCVRCVCGWSRC